MATEIQSTRRSAPRFSAAAFASSLTFPALADGTKTDAELIALCDRIVAVDREEHAIYATQRSADDERRTQPAIDALRAERDTLIERIGEMPAAATVSGLQALSRASLALADRDGSAPYFNGGDAELLALKIVHALSGSVLT